MLPLRIPQLHLLVRHSRHFSSSKFKNFDEFVEFLGSLKGGSVNLAKSESIGVITIDNPASRNALTGSMMLELRTIVDDLSKWRDGKAVIICGSENQFCSGGDLKVFVKKLDTSEHGALMSKFMQGLLRQMGALPLVSVALVQGRALGGGAELMASTDLRVIQEDTKIGFVQSRLGITTGFGGTTSLVNLVGRRNALNLLLSGRQLNAEEAQQMGLADKVVSKSDDGLESCKKWLLEDLNMQNLDSDLVQNLKRQTSFSANKNSDESLEAEREVFRQYWMGPRHIAALNSNIKHR